MDNHERKQSNEEESKQASTTRPGRPDQVYPDLSITMALEEHTRETATSFASMESDSDEDEDDDDSDEDSSSEEYNEYDYEFFESQGVLEGNLIFFQGQESQDSNSAGEEMEEDDIDPDQLSYEELLALGEFIGQEKRGLSLEEIPKCLKPCKFQPVDKLEKKEGVGIDLCVICQVEYEAGETLVALPCEHPYHSECITKWLQIKKICPICSSEVTLPIKTC